MYNREEMKKKVIDALKNGDMICLQLSAIVHCSTPTLRRYLQQMVRDKQLFWYLESSSSNPRRMYTLDEKKHVANSEAVTEIIDGARVFLADDPSRLQINREIMLSQSRVSRVRVYPGTSYGDVALRMPFA